jgi:hypothetical protein
MAPPTFRNHLDIRKANMISIIEEKEIQNNKKLFLGIIRAFVEKFTIHSKLGLLGNNTLLTRHSSASR